MPFLHRSWHTPLCPPEFIEGRAEGGNPNQSADNNSPYRLNAAMIWLTL
jgi:hypothetical protein